MIFKNDSKSLGMTIKYICISCGSELYKMAEPGESIDIDPSEIDQDKGIKMHDWVPR